MVHNSGTRQGSAKAFEHYHRRVRKIQNGLAYHFVIGNGTSTGDGAIEIGADRERVFVDALDLHVEQRGAAGEVEEPEAVRTAYREVTLGRGRPRRVIVLLRNRP